MESCFVNLVEPGEKVIVCQNGVFGGRMKENVERCGGIAVMVQDDWGRAVDPQKVEEAFKQNPDAKILAFVHAETSTGALSDGKTLAKIARDRGALVILDAVTSLGGVPVEIDAWGVDAVYSGSQKCLSCTPGLSPVSFSRRAMEKVRARKSKVQSWFLDLTLVTAYWSGEGKRAYHHTAPINALYGLHEALVILQEEGLQELAKQVHNNGDIKKMFLDMVQSKETHKVSKLMEIIFGSAIGTKSSDVHIEAAEEFARLRYRQDGVLQDIVEFPLEMYKSINSRIKLLSEMKLTSTATAQDGRFTIMYKGTEIEIRTSLIPGPYGESIVMRILNPEGLTVELEEMGIQKKLFDVLQIEIEKPNGMLLTTGPTGSGKTTTLYSFLKRIYTPEIKILTIEDPIEYHLSGVTQTQVDHEKGYDFSSGLRAALRQDPDVIMVGEIRDKETASTAINASLTGHLVLSTLHTNNAAGAIPRLIELGVNPKILPDALTVAMAQRLIRRLCKNCKAEYTPTPHEEKLLRAIVKNGEQTGKDFTYMNITSGSDFKIYKPVGCEVCDNIGYKGRIGLYEAILVDDKVAEIIANNPTERDIKHGSLHQGIFTMVEDGISKILSGITTIEEVQSTVDMIEDLPEGWNQEEVSIPSSEYISTINQDDKKNISSAITNDNNIEFRPASLTDDGNSVHNNMQGSQSVLPIKELIMLIDYLKTLEQEQEKSPEQGIRQKISDLKETIINLLVRSDDVPTLPNHSQSFQPRYGPLRLDHT
jgi:type II secretory ATPase GspE/PulE/Tfp pilus assembly ATPase PilB-like protein